MEHVADLYVYMGDATLNAKAAVRQVVTLGGKLKMQKKESTSMQE